MTAPTDRPLRVVLTGGPGGGKTTAADLYRRELGPRVAVVPESATVLYAGGFPRVTEPEALRSVQRAIFAVQHSAEDVLTRVYAGRSLLCDRGALDGAAYWPDGVDDFLDAMGTTLASELGRYDAVLFFESAAVSGPEYDGLNRLRSESTAEAAALDARLREIWTAHPRFHLVAHRASFLEKVTAGLDVLRSIVAVGTGRP